MIIDEIKKDNLQAMKDKNALARAIYGVVTNKVMLLNIELKKDGKELVDADVVQILQKTIKELTEEKENYIKAGNTAEAENVEAQKELLVKYLPKMLSEDEIKSVVASIIASTGAQSVKDMGKVMSSLKTEYAGKMDFGKASGIIKSLLS